MNFSPDAQFWTYRPPHIPSSKPLQRYYRTHRISMQPVSCAVGGAFVTLYRFRDSLSVRLILEPCVLDVSVPAVHVYASAELDRPFMLALRDALTDIDALAVAIDFSDPAAQDVHRARDFILDPAPKATP